MIDEMISLEAYPSLYWQEELNSFEYLLDASPLIVEKIREHCHHITGLLSYPYRCHHSHQSQPFIDRLSSLKQIDQQGLWVPECPLLGGFGHEINGQLVNKDTLKFYEQLIAMSIGGLLPLDRQVNQAEKKLILELGSGWGGLGYQIKTLFDNVTYVCVDLPQSMLFSAVYLATVFPDCKLLIYGEVDNDNLFEDWINYDFIFVPHYAFGKMDMPDIDIGINTVSFQEMTDGQIDNYLKILKKYRCDFFYSHNRDMSPHNPQLSSVRRILSGFFDIREVTVLDRSYTSISEKKEIKDKSILEKILKHLPVDRKYSSHDNSYEYKHLIGSLEQ
jgi:putative sugar O-methyltransferase